MKKSTCAQFYKNLKEVQQEKHRSFPPDRIWNGDETGFWVGQQGSQKVVAPKGAKHVNTPQAQQTRHDISRVHVATSLLVQIKRKQKNPVKYVEEPGAASR